jgi:hypothetical protein
MLHLFKIALLVILACTIFEVGALEEKAKGQQLAEEDKVFFLKLRQATQDNDTNWICAHVAYPLSVKIGGRKLRIKTNHDCQLRYKKLFSNKIRLAIESQSAENLFMNWQGIMVGRGELWITPVLRETKNGKVIEYYITAINN